MCLLTLCFFAIPLQARAKIEKVKERKCAKIEKG